MEQQKGKILIVTTIAGFLPQFEMNNVKILQELGYQIQYASNFLNPIYEIDVNDLKKKEIKIHHINIQKSPLKILKNFQAMVQLTKIIKNEKIDVVHCHNPMGGVIGRLSAFLTHRKIYTIYTAHGFHFYKGAPKTHWLFFYPVEKLLAKITDQLITINQEDFLRACKWKRRKHSCVDLIPGVGLNIQKYCMDHSMRDDIRIRLEIPKEAFHIVSVGELVPNKNHGTVIKAIEAMDNEHIFYSICGKGPLQEELQNMINKSGLQNRVKLLGYRNDIEKILQSADCFVFPSLREGLGMAAIEALACEVPVIVADNRGTREYVQNGFNGIVCRATNIKEFTNAIDYLRKNTDICEKFGVNGRKTAEKFSLEETEKKMRQIYGRIHKNEGNYEQYR